MRVLLTTALALMCVGLAGADFSSTTAAPSTGDDDAIVALEGNSRKHWTATTIEIVIGIIGLAWVFWGHRTFKCTLFIAGFVLGGCIGGKVALALISLDSGTKHNAELGGFITMLVFGLIMGFAALKVFKLGIFCCGAVLGVILGSVVNISFINFAQHEHKDKVFYGTMAAFGVAGGMFALCCLQRHIIIHATSFSGAYFIMHCIGYWAGDFPNFFGEYARTNEDTPKGWWGYFVGILALYALGIYVQYRHRGREHLHDHQPVAGGVQAKPVANPILQ